MTFAMASVICSLTDLLSKRPLACVVVKDSRAGLGAASALSASTPERSSVLCMFGAKEKRRFIDAKCCM